MKRIYSKIIICLLLTAMLLPIGSQGAGAAATAIPDTIRVGLAYGTGAIPGANLLNSVGSGYRLGYFDEGLNFIQLGYTYETGISVVKTQNVWYGPLSGGLNGYSDTVTTGPVVGSYHLQLPAAYASFDEALAAAGQAGGFVAWVNGVYYVRIGAYLSTDEANTASATITGTTVVGTSNGGMSVVKTGTSTILFQYDTGANTGMLAVKPGLDDSAKTATWFSGNKYYGAFRYQRLGGGNLTVVNILGREDYINCVVSQEMSDGWPVEALKAQAVAARSYAAVCATKHKSHGFDVCSTTDCQAYPGMGRVGNNTTRAATETAGQYVWYNGEIAQTYYFSSDGGATENSENIWTSKLPYIRGVEDPWEATVENQIPKYRYTVTYTKAELEKKLQAANRPCTDLVNVILTPTALGNVKSLTFVDVSGKSWTYSGDSARIFIYPSGSVRFTMSGGSGGAGGYYVNGSDSSISSVSGAYAIDGSGNVSQVGEGAYVITGSGTEQVQGAAAPGVSSDSYTFTGTGYGHNLGMSQWGAYAMAKAGKTYDEILKFYYTGIEVR